jgi:hypothetical protein
MWVVYHSDGKTCRGFVRKRDGMNSFLADPDLATKYSTRDEAATKGKVGHHRDMGGSGFKGQVVSMADARRHYQASRRRYW